MESFKSGTKKSYGSCALHFKSLPKTCIPSSESFGPMVTKLRSRQGNPDAAAAVDDNTAYAADQSIPICRPGRRHTKKEKCLFWMSVKFCCSVCIVLFKVFVLYGLFCHGVLKLDLSTLFANTSSIYIKPVLIYCLLPYHRPITIRDWAVGFFTK